MLKNILVYIDPGFRLGRHYVNMGENLAVECASRGITLLHYVGAGIPKDFAAKHGLFKVFGNGCQPGPESSESFRTDARTILDNLVKYSGQRARVICYMYCGHMEHFKVFSELLSMPQYETIDIKFYMNLSYQDLNCGRPPDDYAEELRYFSDFLESRDTQRRIVGIMDSRQSIKHYQPCFSRTLKLTPIPLYHRKPEARTSNGQPPLTIGYFGQLNEEQGYLLATRLYEEFIENRGKNGVKFLMRVNKNSSTRELMGHFEDFRKKTNCLRIVDGFVETHEHFSMVSECDIVILPYLKEFYPYRTSGIFLDALIHSKVVVVPQDTWMSEMINEYGSGCTFESGDLTSLVSALDRVTEDYSSYAALASRNIARLHSQFSAASLLDMLFEE